MDEVHGKVLGGLLGVACGDSLGATTEFESSLRRGADRVVDLVGGGAFGWASGAPTDDTDLTLAVLSGYVAQGEAGGEALVDAVVRGFVSWYASGPSDVGATTAQAFGRLARGVEPGSAGIADPRAQANGSLMRCLPTGLARRDAGRRRPEARRLSALSHASPVCQDACAAYCDVASALVDGAGVEEALRAPDGRPHATEAVQAVLDDPALGSGAPVPFHPGGWVLTALRIAVWALRQTDRSLEDLLVEVINLGGDSDTNGAIAGGLLGCRDGAPALPDRWLEKLHVRQEMEAAAPVLVRLRG